MAASATKQERVRVGVGGTRRFTERGTITFDSDATVEVETSLSYITGATFTKVGTGGDANALSIDETVASGIITVSEGTVTVDAAASNSNTYFYELIGY